VEDQRIKLKEFLGFNEDESRLSTKNFKYMIYNSEIEKVDYLLKTYLKIRLKKVLFPAQRSNNFASISSRTTKRQSSSYPNRNSNS
jgi:hypothetical protein